VIEEALDYVVSCFILVLRPVCELGSFIATSRIYILTLKRLMCVIQNIAFWTFVGVALVSAPERLLPLSRTGSTKRKNFYWSYQFSVL